MTDAALTKKSGVKPGLPMRQRLAAVQEIETPVWVLDMDAGVIVWANPAAQELWLAESEEELCQRQIVEKLSPRASERLRQYRADFGAGKKVREKFVIYPKGQPRHIWCQFSGIELDDGRTGMLNQVLGQRNHEEPDDKSRSVAALFHTAVKVTLYGTNGHLVYENPAARADRCEGCESLADHFADRTDFDRALALVEREGGVRHVARVNTRSGVRWHEIDLRICYDPVNGEKAYLSSESDITDRKMAEDRADYLARHDPLTGLPNRSGFAQKAERLLLEMAEAESSAALIFIDMDRFKAINDSLGHATGDRLIMDVADRLKARLKGADIAGRLSGDEFLVLCTRCPSQERLSECVSSILEELRKPYGIGNLEVKSTVSLGISRFPADGSSYENLLRSADLAMYEAKRLGGNQYYLYDSELDRRTERRFQLEKGLKKALKRDEFELYYQPRISLRSGAIVGVEALLRWNGTMEGRVGPAEFVPILEETGLIHAVGLWLIEEAADQQQRWKKLGHDLKMSINLSPAQFAEAGFAEAAIDTIVRSGADCSRIEFEITESMLMGKDRSATAVLQTFADAGIKLAIDDFGTGYSNLAYIERYPVSCLKIDRSFIMDEGKRPIVDLIISMCKSLSLNVVAEGVETEFQRRWLAERDCEECQGFLFSPPVRSEEFMEFLTGPGFPALPDAASTA